MEKLKIPARERILTYLRQNRGREIPVSELASQLDLKRTTISNAIKELSFQDFIKIERRSLKRGRYTIVYLTGDLIKEHYTHDNEVFKEKKVPDVIIKEKIPDFSKSIRIEEIISLLKSPDYNPDEFYVKIKTIFPDSIAFTTDFITPLMHQVGSLWALTEISTAEEHVISNRIEQHILARIPQNDGNGKRGLMILVPVEGERHVINLLCLEYILRDLGYSIINLGRALPIRSMIQYIKDLPILPDWIFVSITLPAYLGTIKRNLEYLKSVFQDQIRIAIGGQGISENERNNFPEADVISIGREDLLEFLELLR
ncbi:MAG: HTH domain-containing protein [Candidatus Hodarchaeales archaeon]|jgi:methanogenic corrinoid protein MtbC1/DNA-binding MarR family transcriptional regulator